MARSDAVCSCEQFYCYPLSTADEHDIADIMSFQPVDPGGFGLVTYLQELAYPDEDANLMRTYLVRDAETDELAGYFSLKAGLVSLDESAEDSDGSFDTVPGVELANFAVNGIYRQSHPTSRGCGSMIFKELVKELVGRVSDIVGVYILYIYSLPFESLMRNYRSYGFMRLPPEDERMLHARLKHRYDDQCVFMYTVL